MNFSKLVVILILVISISLVIDVSFAQESENLEDVEPVKYRMGIVLMNIGTIDRQSGSYDLIFMVTIETDDLDLTEFPPPDEWDYSNGYITDVTGVNTEPHFHKFKVRGVFYNQVDFRYYPFEQMELAIHIEPFFPLTADKLVFEPDLDYSGRAPGDTVSVPGWEIGELDIDTYTLSYTWGDFTHLEAVFPVSTTPTAAFLKKLLPVIILGGFGFATFSMSYKNMGDRISLIAAALVSSIFFHAIFLLGELPPLGYLTIADKIMIVVYTLFILNLIAVLLHRYYEEVRKDDYTVEKAGKLDRKMRMLTPIVLLGVFAILNIDLILEKEIMF